MRAPHEPTAPAGPQRLLAGRYVLRRTLDRGGICEVIEAEHVYTGRSVAVKMLHAGLAGDREARVRLIREGRALGACRHPHVVDVLDAGYSGDLPYVVMELLEGRSVEGVLASRGRLAFGQVAQVARQVAQALAAIHAAGVVHRDVKPGNVFVARTRLGWDQARLVDFGVARLPAAPGEERLTGRDGIVGTPEYMPIEQLLGRMDLDGRADLYALGVLMHECLTERVPAPGAFPAVLAQVARGAFPSVRELAPEVPDALADVVDRCLARNADDRYPTARALVAALDDTGLAGGFLRMLVPGEASMESRRAPPVASEAPAPRRQARAPYGGVVTLRDEAGEFAARGEDLSAGGIMVRAERPAPAGATVRVRFALPGAEAELDLDAVVRWVRRRPTSSRMPCALGLQFADPPDAVRAAIEEHLARYEGA